MNVEFYCALPKNEFLKNVSFFEEEENLDCEKENISDIQSASWKQVVEK